MIILGNQEEDQQREEREARKIVACGIDFIREDNGNISVFCRFSDHCGVQKKKGKPDLHFLIDFDQEGKVKFPRDFYCRRKAKRCPINPDRIENKKEKQERTDEFLKKAFAK